jgi:hypothetical protein
MTDSSTGGFLAPTIVQLAEDAALDALFRALVSGVTPLPGNLVTTGWIAEPRVVPRFGTNWCSIRITGEVEEDWSYQTLDRAGDYVVYDWDVLPVTASFYGPNSRSNAKLLKVGLMIGQNTETLFNAGLRLRQASNLVILPDLRPGAGTRFLYRVDIALRFARAAVINYDVLSVESSEIILVSDDHNQTRVINVTQSNPPLDDGPLGGGPLGGGPLGG